MEPVRLICHGFQASGLSIPPYTVESGEVLRLVFPPQAHVMSFFNSPELLKEGIEVAGGTSTCSTLACTPWVESRRKWQNLYRTQTALQWLIDNSQLSTDDARRKIESMGINPHDRLYHLAGTPRSILSLLAVLHQGASGIVFHTIAVEPVAVDIIFRTVFEQLGTRAAIYCQTHVFTMGRTILEEYDYRFSRTVHVDDAAAFTPGRIAG